MLSPRQGGSNGDLIKSGFISINRVNNELIKDIISSSLNSSLNKR
jgi:hypothetical protein